jgi:hypothetical protein
MRAAAPFLSFALAALWLASATPLIASEGTTNRIKIAYITPEKPEQQDVYKFLRDRHVLEKLQEIFSPFRLPIDLNISTKTCGMVNAWYQRQDRNATVTICYELIDYIFKNAPQTVTTTGITRADGVVGHFFYVVTHEMGHAVFDLLDVPIFGGAEIAADQFSTYIMLQFGKNDARRLITGAAHSYKAFIEKPELTIPLQAFSNIHGSSAQRFYNMLCMAYGADPRLFADVVGKGFLPKQRAQNCGREYWEVTYAFKTLIRPHLDLQLAKRVLNSQWLPPEGPRPQVPLPR